jgi:hypothetical protein
MKESLLESEYPGQCNEEHTALSEWVQARQTAPDAHKRDASKMRLLNGALKVDMRSIAEHLDHARDKHLWPRDLLPGEKFSIVEKEINEMAAAMLKGDGRGTRKEALDAIAVLIRIAEGE